MSRLRVSIADRVFETELPPSVPGVPVPFRDFVSGLPYDCEISIRLQSGPAPDRELQPIPSFDAGPDGLLILGEGFRAGLSRDGASGWVEQRDESFPLETLLRAALGEHVQRQGGLLAHGVAVEHGGACVLFVGHSGAGKSTLGRICRDAGLTVLSDELVAVVPREDGVTAYGTPWNIGLNRKATLMGVGLLSWSSPARVAPIPAAEVLRVLMLNTLVPDTSASGRARTFRNATSLVERVAPLRLTFPPDAGAAEAVRTWLSSARTPAQLKL